MFGMFNAHVSDRSEQWFVARSRKIHRDGNIVGPNRQTAFKSSLSVWSHYDHSQSFEGNIPSIPSIPDCSNALSRFIWLCKRSASVIGTIWQSASQHHFRGLLFRLDVLYNDEGRRKITYEVIAWSWLRCPPGLLNKYFTNAVAKFMMTKPDN
jgi:hypothetical protein